MNQVTRSHRSYSPIKRDLKVLFADPHAHGGHDGLDCLLAVHGWMIHKLYPIALVNVRLEVLELGIVDVSSMSIALVWMLMKPYEPTCQRHGSHHDGSVRKGGVRCRRERTFGQWAGPQTPYRIKLLVADIGVAAGRVFRAYWHSDVRGREWEKSLEPPA